MRGADGLRGLAIDDRPTSTTAIAASNQAAIVETLRTYGPSSKLRISEVTGLSAATVNRLAKQLGDRGLVAQAGTEASSGGRPPVVLGVVREAVVVGAVQVHQDRVIGGLVGFDGSILERHERPILTEDQDAGPACLRDVMEFLIARGAERATPLRAIGVSIAGLTSSDGPVTGLDARYWPELPIERVVEGFDVPVTVENDANVLAIGELYRGVGRSTGHFVALILDRGLGSGVVVNGALYRGARAAAGEVGHLLLRSDALHAEPQEHGELEAVLDPESVTRAASRAGIASGRLLTAPEIIALAMDGEARAELIASGVLDGLARAVAALASILDPSVIVLGEGLYLRADTVIPALRQRLEGRIPFVPEIRPASLGADAVLLGAAEMALRATKLPVPLLP